MPDSQDLVKSPYSMISELSREMADFTKLQIELNKELTDIVIDLKKRVIKL